MNEFLMIFSKPDTLAEMFRFTLILYIAIVATQKYQVFKTSYLTNLIFILPVLIFFILKQLNIYNIEKLNFNTLIVTVLSALIIVFITKNVNKKQL
jgi:hypothetical protein